MEEVAQDLLELYARRSVVEGHAFAKDAPWQKELEASFPYVETEDQLRVIQKLNKTWNHRNRWTDLFVGMWVMERPK